MKLCYCGYKSKTNLTGIIVNKLSTRFFTDKDDKTDSLIYTLPDSWWSRKYEYEWVKNFVAEGDVVLDSASGIFHPLKYYLADICREVYACDIDQNIEKKLKDMPYKIIEDYLFTHEQFDKINTPFYDEKIHNKFCSITKLPYEDKKFDKIYCISVLEHLNDKFNRKYRTYKWLLPFRTFIKQKEIFKTMKEFKRVLKDNGLIVLTFDYPDISIEYFSKIVKLLNLEFVADVDTNVPDNAIYSDLYHIYCYRALVRKSTKK